MLAVASAMVLATLSILGTGCSSDPAGTPIIDEEEAKLDRLPRTLRVSSAFGGAHRRMLVEGNTWYQTFANRVLLLDSQTGTQMSEVELAPRGTSGPAADLALRGSSLFVVLEDDAVVELDVSTPRTPRFVARWARPELGIAPRRIARLARSCSSRATAASSASPTRPPRAPAATRRAGSSRPSRPRACSCCRVWRPCSR